MYQMWWWATNFFLPSCWTKFLTFFCVGVSIRFEKVYVIDAEIWSGLFMVVMLFPLSLLSPLYSHPDIVQMATSLWSMDLQSYLSRYSKSSQPSYDQDILYKTFSLNMYHLKQKNHCAPWISYCLTSQYWRLSCVITHSISKRCESYLSRTRRRDRSVRI